MISKNRLLVLLCILTIQSSNIFGFKFYDTFKENMNKITGADASIKNQQPQKAQQPRREIVPQQRQTSQQQKRAWDMPNKDYIQELKNAPKNAQPILPTPLTEEIGSWTATKALLRNAGRNIIGPVIEGTLAAIGYGIKGIASSFAGEENQERRDNLYTGTAGALGAWTLYRWSQGQSIIPYGSSIKSWWYDKGYPTTRNFFQKNKNSNVYNIDGRPDNLDENGLL